MIDIRVAAKAADIAAAIAIDATLPGVDHRTAYIRAIEETGGVRVALVNGTVQAFSCLDHKYFFDRPFLSLLIVSPAARRRGLGKALLAENARAQYGLWTSTNSSNAPMRALLERAGWTFCGEVSGLDEGDPERFYKAP